MNPRVFTVLRVLEKGRDASGVDTATDRPQGQPQFVVVSLRRPIPNDVASYQP